MTCPSCGQKNPSSATVCQFGHDLATGQAGLQKSLKEQVQLIREEVRRTRDAQRKEDSETEVDSDEDFEEVPKPKSATVTKEREESSRFLSFCLDLYSLLPQPWPNLVDLKIAEKASKQGVWAAGVLAVITSLGILDALSTGNTLGTFSATSSAFWFAFVAWGIHRKSRVVAVCALSLYLLEVVMFFAEMGLAGGGIIIPILFVIAFGNSIRGTFAYHKFHAQLRSVIDPETGLPASKIPELPSLPMPVKLLGGVFLTGNMVIVLLGLLLPSEAYVVEGDQLSTDQRATVESLEILEPDEKIQYFYPWGWVGFAMLTDRSLIIHWSADESQFTAPLQDIISISVDYSDSFFEDSQVRVEAIDRELMEQLQLPIALDFFLSPEDEGDRKFIRSLEEATGIKSKLFERADSVD